MRTVHGTVRLEVEFEMPDNEGNDEAAAKLAGSYSVDKGIEVTNADISVHRPAMPFPGIAAIEESPMKMLREFYQEIIDRLPPKREKWEGEEGS